MKERDVKIKHEVREVSTDASSLVRTRKCLYIDMAYSLDELRRREHFQFFHARDNGGYFRKVIALHPLADRVCKLEQPITRSRFNERQDVIEGSAEALKLPRWLRPLNVFISQRRLLRHVARIVREEGLDIIIATDSLYSGLFGYWIKRRTGVPLAVLYVTHYEIGYRTTGVLGMPQMFPFKWLQDLVIRFVSRRADLAAPSSRTLAEFAIEMGVRPDRIKIFSTAKFMVPTNRVPPDQRGEVDDIFARYHIPSSVPLFITVSRHVASKHVDHAIKAMQLIVERHPDAFLLLAGAGPDTDKLQTLTRQLGLEESVRFLGLTPQSVLSRLMPRCIALSPLTGMALFETSMAGCPAVAYDADSQIGELVISGRTGTLVPYEDWRKMGEAASALLDDPVKLAVMRRAMLQHARELTNLDKIYAYEKSTYEQLFADLPKKLDYKDRP